MIDNFDLLAYLWTTLKQLSAHLLGQRFVLGQATLQALAALTLEHELPAVSILGLHSGGGALVLVVARTARNILRHLGERSVRVPSTERWRYLTICN